MIVAILALFVALSGSAYAAIGNGGAHGAEASNKRNKRKRGRRRRHKVRLGKNSVGTRQLKKKSVRTGKIANNAVNGRKVANNSLTGADINLAKLGTVPSAIGSYYAGNANTVAGHAAACPPGTTLIRGICFDSQSNGPAPNLKSAAEGCAARGGYLPTPMELYSVKGILNLGTGVGTDQQLTDAVYADDAGGTYWTMTVDGRGALERQEISNPGRYFCVYALVR